MKQLLHKYGERYLPSKPRVIVNYPGQGLGIDRGSTQVKNNDQSPIFSSPTKTANSNHCLLSLRFRIAGNSDGSVQIDFSAS